LGGGAYTGGVKGLWGGAGSEEAEEDVDAVRSLGVCGEDAKVSSATWPCN
jgi:hypothetical protein